MDGMKNICDFLHPDGRHLSFSWRHFLNLSALRCVDRCVASANLISQILKQVQKECDIEEFVYNIDWVSSGLARIRSAASSAPQLEAQLTQFAIQLEAYHRNLQHHGKKLVDVFSSARRRPALAQHNSRMYNELKFILDSMAQAGKLSDTASPGGTTATRKRSQGQLTSQEAQMFWNKHFLDLELEMVPWDRFVAGFATATGVKLELHEELLLKHVLDNDNLGAVTPKELNSLCVACFCLSESKPVLTISHCVTA